MERGEGVFIITEKVFMDIILRRKRGKKGMNNYEERS